MQKKIGSWKRKFSDSPQLTAAAFPGIPLHIEGDDFISVDEGKIVVKPPAPPHSDRPVGVQFEEAPGLIPRSRSGIEFDELRRAAEEEEKQRYLQKGSSMLNLIHFFKDGKTSTPAVPFPGIPLYAETKVINPIFAKAHPMLASRLDDSECSRRNSIGGSRITASVSAPAMPSPPPAPKDPLEEDDALYAQLPTLPLKSNVESGVYCTIGKRPRMEDVHVVYDNFKEVCIFSFFLACSLVILCRLFLLCRQRGSFFLLNIGSSRSV